MKKKKTREEIATQCYVNVTDIQRLLGISRPKAKEIYDRVSEEEETKPFRVEYTKVPLHRVLDLTGINYGFMMRQIRGSK